ncbi:MAG: dTDP-4-dehydrorhamnose 3,5-epimerase [Planctomycetota bacterium]|mgnify:CR=1 FL=1
MKRIETAIPGVCILEPKVFGDARGFFLESWNRQTLAGLGITADWVQDNHSRSGEGVVRGLHWQLTRPQDKLMHVVAGAILDVAVDIRRGSPTFKRWVAVELSAENHRQLYVPSGFAHGFRVLRGPAEVIYKVTDYWDPADERGVIWNDPDLAVDWGTGVQQPQLSTRDAALPRFSDMSATNLPVFS